MELTE